MVRETRFYELLNISSDADSSAIKKAYKTTALRFHPDKNNSSDPQTKHELTRKFQEVTKAYETLSNQEKRRVYDTYGESALDNPPAETATTSASASVFRASDPNDIIAQQFQNATNLFDHIFGEGNMFFGRFRQQQQQQQQQRQSGSCSSLPKGKNIMDTVHLSLKEFYTGKSVKLKLSKRIICTSCFGKGGSQAYSCSDCSGTGILSSERRIGMSYQRFEMSCASCNGTGTYIPPDSICSDCNGLRLVDTSTIIDVVVPPGVQPGYQICYENAADQDINIIPGDVIIIIQEDAHRKNSQFHRRGHDIFSIVKIPLYKALCGGLIKFKHINDEIINIYVNRGDLLQPIQTKVVKGYGMPIHDPNNLNNISYGDLIIQFESEFPQLNEMSDQQQSMLQQALQPSRLLQPPPPAIPPISITSSSSSQHSRSHSAKSSSVNSSSLSSTEDLSPMRSTSTGLSSNSSMTKSTINNIDGSSSDSIDSIDDSKIVYLSDFEQQHGVHNSRHHHHHIPGGHRHVSYDATLEHQSNKRFRR